MGIGNLCLGVAEKPLAQKQVVKCPTHEFLALIRVSRNESGCLRGKEGVAGGREGTSILLESYWSTGRAWSDSQLWFQRK